MFRKLEIHRNGCMPSFTEIVRFLTQANANGKISLLAFYSSIVTNCLPSTILGADNTKIRKKPSSS